MHSPVFVLYMARCQQELGATELARELYRKAADEPLSEESPAVWREAQASARAALGALEASEPREVERPAADRNGDDETGPGATQEGKSTEPPPAGRLFRESSTEPMPPYRYGAYAALGAGWISPKVGG